MPSALQRPGWRHDPSPPALSPADRPARQGASGEPGLVLSTDLLRAELFGDAAVQGPWDEIRALLLQRLREAVAAGRPVIDDATHARRPWRLLYTQHLQLSRPVDTPPTRRPRSWQRDALC